MIHFLLRVLLVVALLAVVCWILFRRPSRRQRHKCEDCVHAVRISADGVICRYGAKTTFKNRVHIENCHDFERSTG
jgi:hypothetical protein